MHLLLIRHGESVDNVAGLYAGSRDSPLTNHGVLQAKRLGAHLSSRCTAIGPIIEIFASNLQRAYKTGEAVAEAQAVKSLDHGESPPALKVLRLTELREKDFGSAEGTKFGTKTGEASVRTASDAETRDAMAARVSRFIDAHLLPTVERHASEKIAVAVVAHGIILNVLLRALLGRFPAAVTSSLLQQGGTAHGGEFLASWSNTGVLCVKMEDLSKPLDARSKEALHTAEAISLASTQSTQTVKGDPSRKPRFSFVIESINNVDHLAGLKKTRGGIGSARFDTRQRTMDSFFTSAAKKRKADSE